MQFVSAVLERWRGATSSRDADSSGGGGGNSERPSGIAMTSDAPMLQPSLGLDPDRFSLLKKPLR
jgi:hypothetical protein